MIFDSMKLVIFSIILGTLTLIYNNDFDVLYKNLNYENIVLGQIKYRSLAESSYEHRTNQKHKNSELREYQKTKEEEYKKNKYPNDDAKTKQQIPQGTENENTRISNKMSSKKEIYNNAQGGNSDMSPGRLRYLEIQRKLYNDIDEKHQRERQYYLNHEYDSKGEKCMSYCFGLMLCCPYFPHAICTKVKKHYDKTKNSAYQ
ncbi:stevor PIR protein, putative [Plasmodium gaboni]|uniref:Stevor PIR protein, putative n=1 Tax=Plasmodium gaboni TaxID=647221 RepID=A0ABY0KXV9_9APIC|nr:stevor PIR protein, putative [Plasmodium gaboni]